MFGAVLGWAVGGGVVAAGGRWWLGRLRRGAVIRFGLMELTGALLFAVTALATDLGPRLLLSLTAATLLVVLGAVDLKHHRLPDALTLPAIPVALVVVWATEILHPGSGSVLRAVICGVGVWLLFLVPALLWPRTMGRGDAKLVPSLGMLTGYLAVEHLAAALAVAFVVAALVSLVGMLVGRLGWQSAIAFGPYLLFGAWLLVTVPIPGRV